LDLAVPSPFRRYLLKAPPFPFDQVQENVIISPHSASTSDRENGRITDIFCENLRRFLAGDPLLNVLDVEKLY